MTGCKRPLSGEGEVSECKRPCNNIQSPQVPTTYWIPKLKSPPTHNKPDNSPSSAGTTQRPAPEVAQQSVCNGVNHTEAGRPLPDVPVCKPLRTVKIKRPPITEFPSPDHDYSAARPPIQPKSIPAPVSANNNENDDLPHNFSSEAAKAEDPPPTPAPAKKAVEATPRSRKTGQRGQTNRSYSKTMMTHQYENKEKNIVQKKGNNPKRYALCQECEGCRAPDCDDCNSCRMWAQYKDQIPLGKPTCDNRVCVNPVNLYNTRVAGTMGKPGLKQEDGCCPLKVIKGSVYDFRCVFCKHLPRVGSANRSELYRHYSVYHYTNELNREYGRNLKRCPICKDIIKTGSSVSHVGQTHNEVEKYLPASAKIPMSVQGKGGARRRRMKAVVVHSLTEVFPAIPYGWNPATRQIEDEEEVETPKTIIDGFEMEDIIEDEEPLFVSREDPVTMPDYSGDSAICGICKISAGKHNYFADILDAVRHVHQAHGVLGGSQILMLDADRMLKSGYLSLTAAQVPDVDTAPAETVEKEITGTGSEISHNIVGVLQSQSSQVAPGAKEEIQPNYLSQVIV